MAKMEIWESKFVDHVVDATPCTDSDALGLDKNITSYPRPPWPRRSRSRDFTHSIAYSLPHIRNPLQDDRRLASGQRNGKKNVANVSRLTHLRTNTQLHTHRMEKTIPYGRQQ